MTLAVISFLLIFAAMPAAYLLLQRHSRLSVARIQTTRLAARDETEASARRQDTAMLIRRDKPESGGRIRSLASRIQSDERLSQLLEKAGVRCSSARFLRKCGLAAAAGAIPIVFLAPNSLAWGALPVAALCGAMPVLQLKRKVRRR